LAGGPNSAYARCNRRKAFLNEGNSLAIQDESGENIKKSRFREQALGCFGKITSKLLRRVRNLLKQAISSFNDRDEVFKIVTGLEVHLAPTTKCLHFRAQKERRGYDAD
jgi:hypothetical protein